MSKTFEGRVTWTVTAVMSGMSAYVLEVVVRAVPSVVRLAITVEQRTSMLVTFAVAVPAPFVIQQCCPTGLAATVTAYAPLTRVGKEKAPGMFRAISSPPFANRSPIPCM